MVATFGTVPINDEIRVAKLARLRRLQVRAAQLGYDAPPEVLNEIQEILVWLGEAAPGLVDSHGVELNAASPTYELVSDAERYQSLFRGLMLVSGRCEEMYVKVDRLYWLLPTMLFVYLIAAFVLEHLKW